MLILRTSVHDTLRSTPALNTSGADTTEGCRIVAQSIWEAVADGKTAKGTVTKGQALE